jgi:mannose-6-phosphate isomerase-like protein (cupin superfamily)
MASPAAVRVLCPADWGPELKIMTGSGGYCRAVVWPGVGARERSLHYFHLPTGAGTVPLSHPGEAVYYVVSGSVVVEDLTDTSAPHPVREGGMFHIDPGTSYSFRSDGGVTVVIGGPCPADDSMYLPGDRG